MDSKFKFRFSVSPHHGSGFVPSSIPLLCKDLLINVLGWAVGYNSEQNVGGASFHGAQSLMGVTETNSEKFSTSEYIIENCDN